MSWTQKQIDAMSASEKSRLGIPYIPAIRPAEPGSHRGVAESYDDATLEAIYQDLKKRNLRDYSNHETRWLAERQSVIAAERRCRIARGEYTAKAPKRKEAA